MKRLLTVALLTTGTITGSFFLNVYAEPSLTAFQSDSNSYFSIPSAEAANRKGSRRQGGTNSAGKGSRYVGGTSSDGTSRSASGRCNSPSGRAASVRPGGR